MANFSTPKSKEIRIWCFLIENLSEFPKMKLNSMAILRRKMNSKMRRSALEKLLLMVKSLLKKKKFLEASLIHARTNSILRL